MMTESGHSGQYSNYPETNFYCLKQSVRSLNEEIMRDVQVEGPYPIRYKWTWAEFKVDT